MQMKNIKTIFLKELKDTLRDRRTMIFAFLMPRTDDAGDHDWYPQTADERRSPISGETKQVRRCRRLWTASLPNCRRAV